MKFTSKEDIEAPVDYVWSQLSEFEAFERSAIRRGAEVHRVVDKPEPQAGMTWDAKFELRGKEREAQIELVTYDEPNEMVFETESAGLSGYCELELVALSPRRTRLSVSFEMKPRTLPARLLIQSLKLAKTNLTKRFKLRVADYAKDMEDRYARSA
ncbi:SRPBCC family protein [Thalassococcus sp. S3]|uniref:SRPBCC family protein n=1 Tax=Thalassococcus sp. S3 TaxID=2017482 RepID=UPI0010247352|nr:SRPBCC family protein [Thalassococcus sp. S3]QBF33490.1 hypothetical protein CFI11_20075 [Thalassococcus sp. S3]